MESSRSIAGATFMSFTLFMLTVSNVDERAQEWLQLYKMGIITNGRNTSHRYFGHGVYVFKGKELRSQFSELWAQHEEETQSKARAASLRSSSAPAEKSGGGTSTGSSVKTLDLEKTLPLPALMLFGDLMDSIDGATSGEDLSKHKMRNDAIYLILGVDAWLKNKFVEHMSPEVYNLIFGAHTTPAEVSLRDMVAKFEEKLLPMTMSRCANFYTALYQPIKNGESIETFCLNVRRLYILLTRQAKFPGPGEPALCIFLYQQLLPFILGDFSTDFRRYQDETLEGDLHEMTLESFIRSVHDYNARRGVDAKASFEGKPIGISAIGTKVGGGAKANANADRNDTPREGNHCPLCSKADPIKPVRHFFDLEFCRLHPKMKDQVAGKSLEEAKAICAAAWKAHKKSLPKKA